MEQQWIIILYVVVVIFGTISSFAMAIALQPIQGLAGARWLQVLFVVIGSSMACVMLSFFSPTIELALFLHASLRFALFGPMFACFVLFILANLPISPQANRLLQQFWPLWFVLPTVIMGVVLIPAFQPLFFKEYEMTQYGSIFLRRRWTIGPFMQAYNFSSVLVFAVAMILSIWQWRRSDWQARQPLQLLVIILTTLQVATILNNHPIFTELPILSLPFGVFVMTVLGWLLMHHYDLSRLVLLARSRMSNYAQDLLVLVDQNGIVLDLNPSMERFSQQARRSLIGQSINKLLPLNDPAAGRHLLVDTANPAVIELEIGQPPRLYELSSAPIEALFGRWRGRLLILRDIHEARRQMFELARREKRYAALFDQMRDAVVLLDREGLCLEANSRLLELVEYSLESLRAKPVLRLVAPSNQASFREALKLASMLQPTAHLEVRMETNSGRLIPVELSITPIYDVHHQFLSIQVIARSLIERKQLEASERERRQTTLALRGLAEALAQTIETEVILDLTLSYLERVLPYDAAVLLLVKELDDDHLMIGCQRRAAESRLEPLPTNLIVDSQEAPVIANVLLKAEPIAIAVPSSLLPILSEWPLRFQLVAPLRSAGEVLGVLIVASNASDLRELAILDQVQIIADQSGSALQKARLALQVRESAQLEERQRLARELHDAVSQTLFSANLILDMAVRMRERQPDLLWEQAPHLQRLIRSSFSEMRALLHELRPTTLTHTPLTVLFGYLIDGAAGRTSAQIQFERTAEPQLPALVHLAFYRIAQEALNNSLKHAQAQQIRLTLEEIEDEVVLQIQDDGIGFAPEQVRSDEHFGLTIMHERAKSVGAVLSIRSHPDGGTQLTLRYPTSSRSLPADIAMIEATLRQVQGTPFDLGAG